MNDNENEEDYTPDPVNFQNGSVSCFHRNQLL